MNTQQKSRTMESSKLKTSTLAAAWLIKPVVVMGTFISLRAFVDPLYSNPQCAARLVNETDPRAYSVHPSWSGMAYDDSCAGEQLAAYRENQFSVLEGTLQVVLTNMWNALAVVCLLVQCAQMKWAGVGKALRYSMAALLMGYMGATVVLMHTHFEQDVTFMTGAIIHHAESKSPGLNLEKGTISQGYLLCGMANRFFYSLVFYLMITGSPRLRAAFNPWVVVALLNLAIWLAVSTVKHKHPLYHEVATPEMVNAWPYTFESRAYKHVIVHHDTGESFSGDPFLDPMFDWQLHVFGRLHNSVLKLTLNTPGHFTFATIFDHMSGAACVAVLYLYLHIGACITPKSAMPLLESQTKKTKAL